MLAADGADVVAVDVADCYVVDGYVVVVVEGVAADASLKWTRLTWATFFQRRTF